MPATDSAYSVNPDLILEHDDPNGPSHPPAPEAAPWRILIVDDDVDVHVVTKFALSNNSFQGRRLSFLHAYSGKEAIAMLRTAPDIALVLLDVVMETADAGLRVARQIREELGNELVRIVLRTGQPGQAPEHSIIVDYDIDDFWCKADLTTRKLFATVMSSLRAYASLAEAAAARAALTAAPTTAVNPHAAAEQHQLVLTLDPKGRIIDANDSFCTLAGIGRDELTGRDLHSVHPGPFPEPLARNIIKALARDGGWGGDIRTTANDGSALDLRCAILSSKDPDGVVYQHVAVASVLDSGS
jgi:PAS domain S-box-containing protein